MQTLGVFENIYGEGAIMDLGQTLLISVVGFGIVFLVLGFLAIFVYGMGKVFDVIGKKKEAKEAAAAEAPAAAAAAPRIVSAPGCAVFPVWADTSAGSAVPA